jgi:hypothetical protein
MNPLTIQLTLTPGMIAGALVYDAFLVLLGVAAVRRLRAARPLAPSQRAGRTPRAAALRG